MCGEALSLGLVLALLLNLLAEFVIPVHHRLLIPVSGRKVTGLRLTDAFGHRLGGFAMPGMTAYFGSPACFLGTALHIGAALLVHLVLLRVHHHDYSP